MVMEILEKKHTSVNQCKIQHCQIIAFFDSVTIVNGNSVQVYTKCNGPPCSGLMIYKRTCVSSSGSNTIY